MRINQQQLMAGRPTLFVNEWRTAVVAKCPKSFSYVFHYCNDCINVLNTLIDPTLSICIIQRKTNILLVKTCLMLCLYIMYVNLRIRSLDHCFKYNVISNFKIQGLWQRLAFCEALEQNTVDVFKNNSLSFKHKIHIFVAFFLCGNYVYLYT